MSQHSYGSRLFGFFYAFGIFILFVFIAASALSLRGMVGIIVGVLILGLGVVAAYMTYSFTVSQGVLTAIGGETFSSDLDTLEPIESDGVRKLSAQALADNFAQGEHWFKGGTLRLWDDYKKRQLNESNVIESIHYDPDEEVLVIDFKNQNQLTVWHPAKIYEASTYLKIIRASKVVWKWDYQHQHQYYFEYVKEDKRIATRTNIDWIIGRFDLSVAHPAVIILGFI